VAAVSGSVAPSGGVVTLRLAPCLDAADHKGADVLGPVSSERRAGKAVVVPEVRVDPDGLALGSAYRRHSRLPSLS